MVINVKKNLVCVCVCVCFNRLPEMHLVVRRRWKCVWSVGVFVCVQQPLVLGVINSYFYVH